ncbi:MAG: 4Fe-4S dicluster domain-containing protein [Dissulfurimicrobium sp.]|uniref:4Fe-4S dicluster domain-containing protein n=1 Tax=Dissulfurimicrobium TaxID=1769732 RepID=UPI001EDA11C0|nr:4Fe-4S dicluster domain-containing protein [Dissulfurimicrobium hydrothermale]UKL13565.1 4Fe-4S dicluster domain-containing protein [Dissulfurimicrobium hydrothermale]
MRAVKIDRDGLSGWLLAWASEFESYGLIKDEAKGQKTWLRINKANISDALEIPAGAPKTPIKTFFFPQPEIILTFSARHTDQDAWLPRAETIDVDGRRVLFGVRPCDARSIMLNAMPFEGDPYFRALLERTVIVGFSCGTQCSTCFCRLVGGSPYGTDGLDILITEMDDGLVAEVLTHKGEDLLLKAADGKGDATNEDIACLRALRSAVDTAEGQISRLDEVLRSKDMTSLYNRDIWQPLSESCINCGACTFLCPTCYCFDIQDEIICGQGRRIRCWDSCMFPLFTLHASGHNPRGEALKRVRNRFMHKLKYFPDRFGFVSCVGCGRCIRECPVNIDIREVIHDLVGME